MTKLILLTDEQIEFLNNCAHQHCPETWSPRYQEFKNSVIDSLKKDVKQEMIKKIREKPYNWGCEEIVIFLNCYEVAP